MITFLAGVVVEKQPTRVILEVHGVGYEVFIPISSYDRLPPVDAPCRILTVDHVREDSHLLFGFMTEEERAMFTLLVATSGIGPKLALSALSSMSVRELTASVVGGDVKRLSSISGIGRKTAERLVVELRDRIGSAEALEALAGPEEQGADEIRTRDAVMALVALGYKQESARKMVRAALRSDEPDLAVETIVKRALGA